MVKQTNKFSDVGLVPEDWVVKRLGDCLVGRPKYGIGAAAVPYNDTLPTYLRITDISDDGRYLKSQRVSVNNSMASSYFLSAGEIVFARTGASVGKTYHYEMNDGKLVFAGFLIKVRPNECLNSYFLKYLTQTKSYWSWIVANSMRSGQPGINSFQLEELNIPLPKFNEQISIATTLKHADALIASLEKLIAKKRLIKQGVMQKLLTPKKGWITKPIGDDIDLLTGYPFPSNKYSKSGTRLLRGSNVKRGITDWNSEITQYWDVITSDLKEYILRDGDIVIAMDGSLVGRSFAQLSSNDLPALLLQRVARVRSIHIDMGYLKEFICSDFFTKHCDSVKTSSAIPHISPHDIRSFQIPMPPTKNEQEAISSTLVAMSAEIVSLEMKLAKHQKLKHGMMQALLTGRIRLI